MDVPFIGPSYQVSSPAVDCQRSVNLYVEVVESKDGKNVYWLRGTPGLKPLATLPTSPHRGAVVLNGTIFCVAGTGFYSLSITGAFSLLGTLLTGTGSVGITTNGLQITVVDGPNEYVYTFASQTFSVNPAESNFLGATTCTTIDTYTVFAEPNSTQFFLSALNDSTTISDLDVATKEGQPDVIVAVINLHRQLYILGARTIEIWVDTGAETFPFAPIQGVFIETGCIAPFSVCKSNNTLAWLHRDDRGEGMVYAFNNYIPTRISNHAVEKTIKSWGDLETCIGYSYQYGGHEFYVLNGPLGTADTTWVYDWSTQEWAERQWFNPLSGQYERHRVQYYAFLGGAGGGSHIGFDHTTGQVYVMDEHTYTDFGTPLHRMRISPHTFDSDGLKRVVFRRFQLDMEVGVGLDGLGQGTDPQVMLTYSDDGGYSYGPERWRSAGKIGNRKARVYWNKCGSSRDRVWKVVITDPVKVALIAAKLEAQVCAS